jgi:Tir chaperone protein (CesT) family
MDKSTHLRERLIALAEGEPTIVSLVALDEDSFVLQFESGLAVEVENLTDSRDVALTGTIGTPNASERLRVYEAALIYGLLWRDNGGVRMALTEQQGVLVQPAELPALDMTLGDLTAVVKNFADKALIWRGFLEPQAAHGSSPGLLEQELRA